MTICPVALAVGCKKCPIFAICPAKGMIGDFKKEEPEPPKSKKSSQTKKSKK